MSAGEEKTENKFLIDLFLIRPHLGSTAKFHDRLLISFSRHSIFLDINVAFQVSVALTGGRTHNTDGTPRRVNILERPNSFPNIFYHCEYTSRSVGISSFFFLFEFKNKQLEINILSTCIFHFRTESTCDTMIVLHNRISISTNDATS